MRLITLAIHSFLLISMACTQKPSRGLDIYHKFYELPNGVLKIFYCEIGDLRDVRVEYKDRNITSTCQDYDRQRNELWRECTIKLRPGERNEEGLLTYDLVTSGSLSVNVNGVERHTICGYNVNATTCLVTIFART